MVSTDISLISDKIKPNKLLMLLLSKKGTFISGEELSKEYGVTRSAIWKQINVLRDMGYIIRSSPRLGYMIDKSPDLLIPEEIWSKNNLTVLGNKIYYYSVIGSTNEAAKKLAQEGTPHGTLLIAERQEKARGRMGRAWSSPHGGIWLSIILRPNLAPQEAPKLTMMTAVAVTEAIIEKTGINARIKWPNDILIDGKKACGILTEMSAEMDAVNYVIVGIGINVNNEDFPSELKNKSICLKQKKGQHVGRLEILTTFLERFENHYITAENRGFEKVMKNWRSLSDNLGKSVKITGKNYSFEGIALDIDKSGALLVKTGEGEVVRVLSGDVSLR